jgi:homoserine O-acetyltransferase
MLVETKYASIAEPTDEFVLACGKSIPHVAIAYETYGELNEAADNAVLICTGFTGDAHAAGEDRQTGRIGWWDDMIGCGKPFDTRRFFVVCTNVLGGCSGSTGPSSINPLTDSPYGCDFPALTIRDLVNAQHRLLTGLGVTSLVTVTGASMGGQQSLQWLISYPEFVRSAIPIACTLHLSAFGLAMCEVSRQAIVTDPDWRGGNYYGTPGPVKGLAVARMAAHLTYVGGDYLEEKYGRERLEEKKCSIPGGEFAVQSVLHEECAKFVQRFDANSYLYLSHAIESFDLTREIETLNTSARYSGSILLLSFSTDILFPAGQVEELGYVLQDIGAAVQHITVETTHGHDAFITEPQKIGPLIATFLCGQTLS